MRAISGLMLAAMLLAASTASAAPPTSDGASLFAQNCAACHQATGKGIPGAFPALAGDPFVKAAPAPVISTVLKGRGGMPRFADQLDDATIASVLTYVRGAWGNGAPAVKPAQVAALRTGPAPAHGAGLQAH